MEKNIENTISLNIFGGCVSRDIFPKDSLYKILQYVSFSSPMSLCCPKGSRVLTADDLSELEWGSDFSKRCQILDINKTGLDYLSQKTSDWLILDFADIRLPLIKYGSGQYTTFTNLIKKNPDAFRRLLGEYKIEELRSTEEYLECIEEFGKRILMLYPPERIILHKYFLAEQYRSKKNELLSFDNIEKTRKINSILRTLYERFEEMCGRVCFRIEMPDDIIADENNKWGLHPMHYTELYYEYAYRCINFITANRAHPPDEFRELYSLKARLEKEKLISDAAIVKNRKQAMELSKMQCYAKTMNNICKHRNEIIKNLKSFCQAHDLHHVAFWGDFMISETLCVLLKEVGVELDYIICNWNHKTADKVIPNATESYPETDAIIICDVLALEKRRKDLSKRFSGKIFGADELIPLIY